MPLELNQEEIVQRIETELSQYLSAQSFRSSQTLKEMISYHMGWEDLGKHGKRIRPLLTLLCTGAFNGELDDAMPAAISVEFLHNFTLIHDDIEDRSEFRHGRETVWKRWGIAQAINAGDALFCVAQLAMLELSNTLGGEVAAKAASKLNQVCLHLTQGQYLDIALEADEHTEIETYFKMIKGKTAALISFCTALGGIVTAQDNGVLESISSYGKFLGMAFQIQDDYLGIWGNPIIIGKSTSTDLATKKKTLPVLFGLEHSQDFRELWALDDPSLSDISCMVEALEASGAKTFVSQQVSKFTDQAFDALDASFSQTQNGNMYIVELHELGEKLVQRIN